MKFKQCEIEGVFIVETEVTSDSRGSFCKNYQRDFFLEANIESSIAEIYYSISHLDVIRGMHFQMPPFDHDKLVSCLSGEALDVVLDLRKSSPTFGHHTCFKLSFELGRSIFIPRGCAHGFLSKKDNTMMLYEVSTVYNPKSDQGIRYDSFGFDWDVVNPNLSQRDLGFKEFRFFESPF
jgi:dTDP-4-dehydrorhamnose 3,5-epimerase/CDP-3, 6-dideoxy-D-glycero-D-glycero-4-hexulose-5-epimerase